LGAIQQKVASGDATDEQKTRKERYPRCRGKQTGAEAVPTFAIRRFPEKTVREEGKTPQMASNSYP